MPISDVTFPYLNYSNLPVTIRTYFMARYATIFVVENIHTLKLGLSMRVYGITGFVVEKNWYLPTL